MRVDPAALGDAKLICADQINLTFTIQTGCHRGVHSARVVSRALERAIALAITDLNCGDEVDFSVPIYICSEHVVGPGGESSLKSSISVTKIDGPVGASIADVNVKLAVIIEVGDCDGYDGSSVQLGKGDGTFTPAPIGTFPFTSDNAKNNRPAIPSPLKSATDALET